MPTSGWFFRIERESPSQIPFSEARLEQVEHLSPQTGLFVYPTIFGAVIGASGTVGSFKSPPGTRIRQRYLISLEYGTGSGASIEAYHEACYSTRRRDWGIDGADFLRRGSRMLLLECADCLKLTEEAREALQYNCRDYLDFPENRITMLERADVPRFSPCRPGVVRRAVRAAFGNNTLLLFSDLLQIATVAAEASATNAMLEREKSICSYEFGMMFRLEFQNSRNQQEQRLVELATSINHMVL